ncbi:MAG: NAD(P)(+) transhydrogenase (Re/Si-specific) subunit alpha [Alphaproteobacteria bacterium]|nr:NAD(P)(+) transhydrogenase (Re/Si-specific) subunit alpha [Alphaproteobacteria bacterium]
MHTKKIVIFRASSRQEKRVPMTPAVAKKLMDLGWTVALQSGAGADSGFLDADYVGVQIDDDERVVADGASCAICFGPLTPQQYSFLPKTCAVIGLLGSDRAPDYVHSLPAYSLERLPRTSGAQVMDVLTSQSSLYGYWAVLDGARRLPRVMPMMMTPSGRLNPSHVLVLGAGVAGLQAIATAQRLGAVVSAFDVRQSAKGAVESLGAKFYHVSEETLRDKRMNNCDESAGQDQGGYGQKVGTDTLLAQQALIGGLLSKTHLVIATAMVPGQEPPVLITHSMVQSMPPGSVIMDLATDRFGAPVGSSGNCSISRRGEEIQLYGVTIVGTSYGISHMTIDASTMYANNLLAFIQYAWDDDIGGINNNLDWVKPLRLSCA